MAKKATAKSAGATINGAGKAATRSTWKGNISFGLVNFPVELYTGARSESISFNQVCPTHKSGVKQQLVCAVGGEVVKKDELLKGWQYPAKSGKYLTFTPQEIEDLEPESGKVVTITKFVKQDEIDPLWLESSYFVKPDAKMGGTNGYTVLREIMVRKGYVALGTLTKSQREHIVVLRPVGRNGLAMHTLFYNDEVRSVEFEPLPVEANEPLIAVADQLVEAMAGSFDPSEYHDGYRENVEAAIAQKAQGQVVEIPKKEPQRAQPIDLLEQIKASVAAVGKKGAA